MQPITPIQNWVAKMAFLPMEEFMQTFWVPVTEEENLSNRRFFLLKFNKSRRALLVSLSSLWKLMFLFLTFIPTFQWLLY